MKKFLIANWFFRKLFFIFIISALCFLTTQCGFRLKTQNRLPPQFQLVYVASDQPYDKFTILVKQYFKQTGLNFTDSQKTASITLKVIEAKLTHSAPDITTSDKARTFTLTYRVLFTLEDANGNPLLPEQEITTKRPLTLNPGQTLYSNNELNLVKQEMQREALRLLIFRLETPKVRDTLQEV